MIFCIFYSIQLACVHWAMMHINAPMMDFCWWWSTYRAEDTNHRPDFSIVSTIGSNKCTEEKIRSGLSRNSEIDNNSEIGAELTWYLGQDWQVGLSTLCQNRNREKDRLHLQSGRDFYVRHNTRYTTRLFEAVPWLTFSVLRIWDFVLLNWEYVSTAYGRITSSYRRREFQFNLILWPWTGAMVGMWSAAFGTQWKHDMIWCGIP